MNPNRPGVESPKWMKDVEGRDGETIWGEGLGFLFLSSQLGEGERVHPFDSESHPIPNEFQCIGSCRYGLTLIWATRGRGP